MQKLRTLSVYSLQYGGSEREGYSAAGFVDLHDRGVLSVTHWSPVVGVSKNGPDADALITCPPLLCSWRFLSNCSALRVRTPLGRS